MFYRSLEDVDSDASGPVIVGETAYYLIIWCLLEAYVFEGAVKWLATFVMKTRSLFRPLDLEILQYCLRGIEMWIRDFHYLGSGNLVWDWVIRGLIVWACTGLPIMCWRASRLHDPNL